MHAKNLINEQEPSEFFGSFRSAASNITNSYYTNLLNVMFPWLHLRIQSDYL